MFLHDLWVAATTAEDVAQHESLLEAPMGLGLVDEAAAHQEDAQ